MATPVRVRQIGNELAVTMSDGTSALAYPTGSGLWIVHGSGGGTIGAVPAPVDDYPWPNATINTLSPLGYDYRECVDFVAWRLNRDAGVTAAPWKYTYSNLRPSGGNGDAIGWRQDWQINGWPVDIKPVAGCVGYYGTSAGALGHVNYVQAVNPDGTLVLEEYNWGGTHNYGTRTVTPGTTGAPDSYLSIPPR